MEEFEVSGKELSKLKRRLDRRKKLHANLTIETISCVQWEKRLEELRQKRIELIEELRNLWAYGNEGL